MSIKLSNRLSAAAGLVKKGSVVADIGTDHGYIPVYLIENGIADYVIASDINEKPLQSCISYVKKCALEGKIETRLSDGFSAYKENECDTAVIAGMGGEMIADILSKCPFSKTLHLVLQPMTHPEITRKYLYDNGFEINNDIIIKDGRHFYSVFDASYIGKILPKSQKDYYLGNIKDFQNKEYFCHLLNYLRNKSKSGADLNEIIRAVEEIL